MHRVHLSIGIAVVVLSLVGCEVAKSANPTSPSVAGAIPGVAITSPKPLEPVAGAVLVAGTGLVTLLVENASTTGQRSLWLQVEMAADASFQQVVHQADRVTPGPGGRTSYKVPEPLGAGYTYYWRARAQDGANTGPYSAVASFRVVNPVVIEPPVPLEPSGNLTTTRPDFKVRNGAFSGTDAVVYRFEISTSGDFTSNVAAVTGPAGAGGTTSISFGTLPFSQTFYWRAYGTDLNTRSAFSAVLSFRTPAEVVTPPPTPTPTPPPSTGPVGGARTISPSEALQIIRSVHDAEGWNLGSRSTRDERVAFLYRAAATIHYGHSRYNQKGPDSKWCVKDAGGGRPPSDDVIVRCDTREAYDLITGAGADGYSFHIDSVGILPSGQNVYPPPQSALPR